MLILTSINGPQKGKVFEIRGEDSPLFIGRGQAPLNLRDTKISRHHAELTCEGGKWYIRDNDSRNGTRVNRRLIDGETEIESGDWVQVGRTVFAVGIIANGSASVRRPEAPPEASLEKSAAAPADAVVEVEVLADEHDQDSVDMEVEAVMDQDTPPENASQPTTPSPDASPSRTEALLNQLIERVQQQEARYTELSRSLQQATAGAASREDLQTEHRELAARLDAQAESHRQWAQQVREALASQADRLDPALASLLERFDARAAEQRQAIDAQTLAASRHADAITHAVRTAAAENQPDKLDPVLQTISGTLGQHRDMLAQLAAEEVAAHDKLLDEGRVHAAEVVAKVEHAAETHDAAIRSSGDALSARAAELASQLGARVTGVESVVEKSAEQLGGQVARIGDQVAQRITQEADRSREQQARLAAAAQASVSADHARHDAAVAQVAAQVTAQTTSIHDSIARVAEKADQTGVAVTESTARIESTVMRTASEVQSSIASVQASVGAVHESVKQGAGAIDAATDTITRSITAEAVRQLDAIASLRAAVDPVREKIEGTHAAIAAVAQQVVSSVAGSAARHEASLEAAREALASRIGQSEPMLRSLSERLAALAARQEDLAASLREAAQPRAQSDETAPLVRQVLDRVETPDARRAQIDASIAAALTQHAESTVPLLRQVATDVQAQAAGQERLQGALREAAAWRESITPMLRMMADRMLEEERGRRELVVAVREAASREPEKLAPLMASLTELVQMQQARQGDMSRALAAAVEAASAAALRTEPLLQQIAAQGREAASWRGDVLAAVREAVAAESARSEPMLSQLATRARGEEARHAELVKAVRDAVDAGQQRAEDAVRRALLRARIDPAVVEAAVAAQPGVDEAKLVDAVRAVVAAGQARTEPVLARIAAHMDSQSERDNRLIASMREAVESEPVERKALLEQIVAQLQKQEGRHEEIITAIREAMETHPDHTKLLIRQIVAEFETRRRDESRSEDRAASGVTAIPATAGLRLVGGAGGVPVFNDPEPLLRQIKERLDAQEWRYDVVKNADAATERSRWRRAAFAASIGVIAAAGTIAAGIGLANRTGVGAQPGAVIASAETETLLRKAIEQFEAGRVSQEQLASTLRDAVKSQRDRTEPMLKEVLARLEAQGGSQDRLASIIRDSMKADGAGLDPNVRSLIRELRAQREQLAKSFPGTVNSNDALAKVGGNEALPPLEPTPSGSALGRIDTASTISFSAKPPAVTSDGRPLTRLQEAYRFAFQTGMKVTVGGKLDPRTGESLGGRGLDPVAAKAAGCQTWEEWYQRDDKIEQDRLRQQAVEYRASRAEPSPSAPVVTPVTPAPAPAGVLP